MNFDHTSPTPEEPLHQSEHTPLSPASPKPLHFPTPTNVPILEMQTDVDFNQTEPHMADPAMRNTEVRPNLWRDPNEPEEAEEYASPYSTGGEAANAAEEEAVAQDTEPVHMEDAAGSTNMTANTAQDPEAVQLSNDASHQANSSVEVPSAPEAAISDAPHPSSDPSIPAVVPTAQSDPQIVDAHPEQAQPTSALPFGANVDVQALLNTLQVPPSASASVADGVTPLSPSQAPPSTPGHDAGPSSATAAGLGVPPSGLPPRPPPQEQPLINQNYVHSQHIRDYHPHAAHSAFQPQQQSGAQGNVADPSSRNYVPPVPSPTLPSSATAAPQAQAQAYPYTPSTATFQQPPGGPHTQPQTPLATALPNYTYPAPRAHSAANSVTSGTPIESRREHKLAAGEIPTADDRPWDAETQAKYDHFIETERHFVSEGRWEQFPMGSRLFVGTRKLDGSKVRKDEVALVDDDDHASQGTYATVQGMYADGSPSALGNLSSEKVTKRDIFHVFWRYGALAQISIKQAYGFVQFLSAEECRRALEVEQGRQIRDKRIHLEISKPQKNRIPAQMQHQNQ
ncbi:hypothetical protein B0A55_11636, partial [Friedmanniomyces simplex]